MTHPTKGGHVWPWKRQLTASEVPRPLVDRLERVEKTQEEVDRALRKLRLEWEDVYDRIIKAMGRLNARDRTERQRTEEVAQNHAPTVDELNDAIRRGAYGRRIGG